MAEEFRPYFLVGYKKVALNSDGTVVCEVGATEDFYASELRIHSTGAFDVKKVVDQGGTPYSNAKAAVYIDSNLLTAATKNNYHAITLPEPLHLGPATKLEITVTDTSGAENEVWVLLLGKVKTVAAK